MLITEEGKTILKTIITKYAKDSKGKIPENAHHTPRPIFFPKATTDLRNSLDFQNPHLKKSVITTNSLLSEIFRMA